MLRDQFLQLLNGYDSYLQGRRTNAEHPMHKLLHDELPASLIRLTPDSDQYKIEGADGRGNVTEVPWVAAFHKEITDSAQTGYYVVWLLPKDRKTLILELGLGATQFAALYGENSKALDASARAGEKVLRIAKPLVPGIFSKSLQERLIEGPINALGNSYEHKAYGKAAVLSVSYPANNLPSNESISSDYKGFIKLYKRLVASPLMPTTEDLVLDEVVDASTSESQSLQPSIIGVQNFVKRDKLPKNSAGGTTKKPSRKYSKTSKKIGDLGEKLVFEHLKKDLIAKGRQDLAEKTIWHQESANDRTPGWDITSFKSDTGESIFIEVKASQGARINEVILTKREWEAAQTHGYKYHIYLVVNVLKQNPNLEVLQDPADKERKGEVSIEVESWSLNL